MKNYTETERLTHVENVSIKLSGKNVPWKKLFPVIRQRSKRSLFKKRHQIVKRDKAVLLCRFNQRVHIAGTFSTVRALTKQPIFPA